MEKKIIIFLTTFYIFHESGVKTFLKCLLTIDQRASIKMNLLLFNLDDISKYFFNFIYNIFN